MTVNTFNPNQVNIQLSPEVLSHIAKTLHESPKAVGFRFTTKKAGCSGLKYVAELMTERNLQDLALPNALDLPIYVQQESLSYLNGLVVELVKKGLGQTQITYRNPNETARCGCGESFSVNKSANDL